jgi:hypothetical protein
MKIRVPKVEDGSELDVMPDTKISINKLTEAMEMQVGKMAYWFSLAESALQDQKDAKHQLLCMQEDLDGELRSKYEKALKKFTEVSLKAAINRDERVRKLFLRHRRKSRDAGYLKVFAECMKAKKDLLQSLGALSRAEREGEVKTFESKWKAKVSNHKPGDRDGDKE